VITDTIPLTKRKEIKWEISQDECGGAGFVFYGDEKEFDVKSCDCALETWGI